MPTTTPIFGIVKPASDLEPADGYGALTTLADSVEDALSRPYCELNAAASTNIPNNGTVTQVSLATVTHNEAAYFTVTGSGITVLQSGIYDLSARGFLANGTAGWRAVEIYLTNTSNVIAPARFKDLTDLAASPSYAHASLSAGTLVLLGSWQTGAAGNLACDLGRLLVRKVG